MADRVGLNLAQHQNVSTSYSFLAATDYSTASSKIAGKAGWTIYIQLIVLSVTTDNAAVQTFQDSSGTPVQVAAVKASPGVGPQRFDFGAEGLALTEGKDFQHKMSAAGMAGDVVIQAYMKVTGTLTANVAGVRGGL